MSQDCSESAWEKRQREHFEANYVAAGFPVEKLVRDENGRYRGIVSHAWDIWMDTARRAVRVERERFPQLINDLGFDVGYEYDPRLSGSGLVTLLLSREAIIRLHGINDALARMKFEPYDLPPVPKGAK